MPEKNNQQELVDSIIKGLSQHCIDRDEKLIRKFKAEHLGWLNAEMGIDFKDQEQVNKLKGALRVGIAVYTFLGKMGLFIGITIIGGILTGLWHLVSLGIKSISNS